MKNKLARYLILCVIIFISFSCNKKRETLADSDRTKGKAATVKPYKNKYSYNEGMKLAKKLDKMVVIDFYADWCGYCKKMEKETYSDNKVKEKLKDDFIAIRINTDKHVDRGIKYKNKIYSVQEFSSLLGVRGLPTIVFFDNNENYITKVDGFVDKDTFYSILNYITSKCYLSKVTFNDYMKRNGSCSDKS